MSLNLPWRRLVAKVIAAFTPWFRCVLTSVLQYMILSSGAIVVYDYFLTINDEVRQSYLLSAVRWSLKLVQDILRLEGKENLEWVHLTLDTMTYY